MNLYLKQEGIDRRYSQLILQELYDATEMTDDQLNQAANELISTVPDSVQMNGNSILDSKAEV